jgi:hypothetical protein
MTAEVVPNGYWPLDFGGTLGEPVTTGIFGQIAMAERDQWRRGISTSGGRIA